MAVNMYTAEPMPFRFWDKVLIGDGCWEWQARKNDKGRGYFSLGGKDYVAPKVAWMLWYGDPGDLKVLHRCDNPPCVRPDHLWLGTQRDNIRDAVIKGRWSTTKRTHCPQGHPYDEENTYLDPRGRRSCRICRLEQERQRRAARPRRQRSQVCKRGHLRVGENRLADGSCRECVRLRGREWARKNSMKKKGNND